MLRCLRPDRLMFAIARWITNTVGPQFTEPPVLDVSQVLDDSTAQIPLIFVLSPGVDPSHNLMQLAGQKRMYKRYRTLSLGQGQAPIATKYDIAEYVAILLKLIRIRPISVDIFLVSTIYMTFRSRAGSILRANAAVD